MTLQGFQAKVKELKKMSKIYKFFPAFISEDFIIGEDSFEDVEIDSTQIAKFWYFKNTKKGLIKRFVLERTKQIEKICKVTLIKKDNGKFTPRFDFEIWNITNKACEEFSKTKIDENLIKAKVNLNSCHKNFKLLINFINGIASIDFESPTYVVVDKEKKDIFDNVSKSSAVNSFASKYGEEISEKDISILQKRRIRLEHFEKLLTKSDFFESERVALSRKTGKERRKEDIWQNFFEENPWIFGYGLQLVACEGLDDKKLEQTIIGKDIIDGSGKRIDALLKTKSSISKILFCEIKLHLPNLLVEEYGRPGVFVPGKELRGSVAQIQKTIHKANLKLRDNFIRVTNSKGNPTGEELLIVKPKGIVVIGKLEDFKTKNGINYEKLSSFELYRQQINGIEILTYDELYQRTKFIVEES